MVATSKTLPCGWRRYTRFRLTVVNQLSDELSQQRGDFYKAFGQSKVPIFVIYISVCLCLF